MNYIELRTLLTDEKSRIIFDARMSYKKDKKLSSFYSIIKGLEEDYVFREVDEYMVKEGVRKIYIWGNDDFSIYSYQVLKDSGYLVEGLLCQESNVREDGIMEYSVDKVDSNCSDIVLIVFERDLGMIPAHILESYKTLILQSHVVGRTGMQYFDYFEPAGKEYFLDGGAMDGATTNQFLEWCHGNYGAVYAFEANPKLTGECQNNLQRLVAADKLQFYACALWSKKENIAFDNSESKWNAHVDKMGNNMITANCIDHILGDNRVTFIKFDIEGSELQGLYGARECIYKNRPRMAISVYHKDSDLEDIMNYLMRFNLSYKFALRHYHSDAIETILYVY